MKKILPGLLFILCVTGVYAQEAKQLIFREEIFDFGTVAEQDGAVEHEFVFTNNADRPVKILSVRASCGCTTPGWSKAAVGPGETGFVKASYNPSGRPGHFNKSLTVTTDLAADPVVLYIKGHVSSDRTPVSNEYPIANGALRLKGSSFNMGKVFLKDEFAMKDFVVYNDGDVPVSFTGKVVAPEHIRVQIEPSVLQPRQEGVIHVGYNGKQKNRYGFQSDNIEIHTNDEVNPVKSFTVYATLEEYFPPMTAEALAKAPRLELETRQFDFGSISGVAMRDVTITNAGRNELHVRAIQPNCTCIKAHATDDSIGPGETGTLKISFDPQDRKGTQQKAVYIYSDDPRNPVQRLIFKAYVR